MAYFSTKKSPDIRHQTGPIIPGRRNQPCLHDHRSSTPFSGCWPQSPATADMTATGLQAESLPPRSPPCPTGPRACSGMGSPSPCICLLEIGIKENLFRLPAPIRRTPQTDPRQYPPSLPHSSGGRPLKPFSLQIKTRKGKSMLFRHDSVFRNRHEITRPFLSGFRHDSLCYSG